MEFREIGRTAHERTFALEDVRLPARRQLAWIGAGLWAFAGAIVLGVPAGTLWSAAVIAAFFGGLLLAAARGKGTTSHWSFLVSELAVRIDVHRNAHASNALYETTRGIRGFAVVRRHPVKRLGPPIETFTLAVQRVHAESKVLGLELESRDLAAEIAKSLNEALEATRAPTQPYRSPSS